MNLITNLMDAVRMNFGRGFTHGGKRDTWSIFGYPETLTIKDYRDKYRRGDIAARIVDAYPNACWSNPPEIIEDKKEQDRSQWEKSVDKLLKELNFWHHVRKLDKLVNLGNYAVLYLGFADAVDLSKPVTKGAKLIYLKPLAQDVAVIKTYEDNITDKRFGLPATYELTLKNGTKTIVHWSRVIHVAERTIDNDYEGQSILEFIWNKLLDLEKVSGGCAEIWWLNARGGLSLEADSETELEEGEKEKLKEEVENYQHNLTRVIRTRGIKISPINNSIASPKDQFDILISMIAGSTAIPKRILLGNEAGELASSQDETNWNKQVKDRQANFCEVNILNAFIDYLMSLGVVDSLKEEKSYKWEWPALNSISDKDKAVITKDKTSALVAYANSPEADTIIPPKQFVEEVLEMEYREDEIADIIAEENAAIDASLQDPNNPDNGDSNQNIQ